MTFLSTADGLASNDVDGITQDLWGRMYVVTGRGIDSFYPTFPLRVTHYTTADGLIYGGLGAMAFRDRHGALWFGNQAGLMRLDPVADRLASAPPVTISELRIRGVRRALAPLGEMELNGLELPADQNQVEIGFVGLEFRAGKKLTYQYRLESDSDWSPAAAERTVNFASLAPGNYRFLVRAVSSEGLVSEKPAGLAFTIVPPVWQRWWARVLMLLVLGAAFYALYRYRLEHLLAVERVRARIATDLHDDIGSTLSQISILSEVASREARERERLESLREIADLSRESVGSMSDIVWAIDPEQDRIEQLSHRMRRFASDLSLADGVQIRFVGLADDRDLRLDADMRRQIFLIFKESLHNALRHSGCTQVDVELSLNEGWLKLSIQDNGRGFDAKRTVAGHGLLSIEKRARILGGEVEFLSAPDAGTQVLVNIPIAGRRLRRWRKAHTNG
jgi:signal transduction histidine kinase